jgi:hypothetical protein
MVENYPEMSNTAQQPVLPSRVTEGIPRHGGLYKAQQQGCQNNSLWVRSALEAIVMVTFEYLYLYACRPTMILYNVPNIRDLFGHKVK